ncbi:MAG TPA: hypothetical protein VGM10_09800 [Actinocrinis sp.]|jgi:hypothetical protein
MRRRAVAVLGLVLPMGIGGTVAAFAAPGANAPAAAPAEVICQLVVPADPLSAQGLATPYQLEGADGQTCNEANPDDSAFAQGLVIDPATGQVTAYDPLIIDQGTQAAVAPVVPDLPSDAVVALWFGFNGNVLTLSGPGMQAGGCTDGLAGSPFGQVSYCNAVNFFNAANQAIANGQLTVPPIGTAKDGESCMTTRDFGLVDQDQSDNVTTTYLALPNGQTAQNTSVNATSLNAQGAQVLANGSDNLLLDHFVDPAIGCTPWSVPDLANGGALATDLGLNELQAAADQAAPVALVPLNDPMTLDNDGNASPDKTDLYREGVDQPPLSAASGDGTQYCDNIIEVGMARTQKDESLTVVAPTPDAGMADNLFTFLASRLQGSYDNLNCEQFTGQPNPITITTDTNGVAVEASFGTFNPNASPSATASQGGASSSPTGAPATSAAPSSAAPTSAAPTTAPPATSAAPATSDPDTQAPPPATSQAPPPPTTTQAAPPPATTQAAQPQQSPAAKKSTAAAGGSGSGSGGSGSGTGGSGGSGSGSGGTGSGTSGQQGSTGGGTGTTGGTGAKQSTAAAAPKASASASAGAALEVAGFEGQKPPDATKTATAVLTAATSMKSMNDRLIWALVGSVGALLISMLLWPPNRRRLKRSAGRSKH